MHFTPWQSHSNPHNLLPPSKYGTHSKLLILQRPRAPNQYSPVPEIRYKIEYRIGLAVNIAKQIYDFKIKSTIPNFRVIYPDEFAFPAC